MKASGRGKVVFWKVPSLFLPLISRKHVTNSRNKIDCFFIYQTVFSFLLVRRSSKYRHERYKEMIYVYGADGKRVEVPLSAQRSISRQKRKRERNGEKKRRFRAQNRFPRSGARSSSPTKAGPSALNPVRALFRREGNLWDPEHKKTNCVQSR